MDIKDTISGFQGVLEGKYDDLPEMAFYMVRARMHLESAASFNAFIFKAPLRCAFGSGKCQDLHPVYCILLQVGDIKEVQEKADKMARDMAESK